MGLISRVKNLISSKPAKKTATMSFNDFKTRIRASYDSANTNALNSKHWAYADGLSADAALSQSVRKTIRQRARYEFANNTYAQGMIGTLTDNLIGIGPRLQLLSDNATLNKEIEIEFTEWMRATNLTDKLRTMQTARVRDGEIFFIYQQNPKINNAIKTELVLIECDRVTDPELSYNEPNNIDGVFVDSFGNPVKYRVLKDHPGSNIYNYGEEYSDIKSEYVLHHYKIDRPGQHRGISEISAALPLFALLRRLTLATIYAAENAAEHAGVLTTPMPAESDINDESDGLAGNPFETIGVEYNGLTILPDGYDMKQYRSEHPNSRYAEFKREILSEIARCLSIPRNVAQGDSSGYNYASGRLDHQVYFKKIRVDQEWIGRTILDKIFYNWLWEYAKINSLSIDSVPHQWFWDGLDHVDPMKEAKAQETRLLSKTTTYSVEYAKQGLDWEEQFEQIAREQKRMKELGIVIDLTPNAADDYGDNEEDENDDENDDENEKDNKKDE